MAPKKPAPAKTKAHKPEASNLKLKEKKQDANGAAAKETTAEKAPGAAKKKQDVNGAAAKETTAKKAPGAAKKKKQDANGAAAKETTAKKAPGAVKKKKQDANGAAAKETTAKKAPGAAKKKKQDANGAAAKETTAEKAPGATKKKQDTNGAAAKETTAEKAPGATKKKKLPREIWNFIVNFFKSPIALHAAIILSFLLFVATITTIALYAAEREKTANLRGAVRKISRFMKVQEPRLRTQLDIDVLNETQKYADILASWSAKIVELDEAIADITKRIANDWNVHGGSLFLFQADKHSFNEARHACTTRDSILTSIGSPEEEEFIESRVKGSPVDYWIGLYKWNNDWVWEEGRPLIQTFWGPGEPTNKGTATGYTNDCVFVDKNCALTKQCWRDSLCGSRKGAICRLRPNKKWMH